MTLVTSGQMIRPLSGCKASPSFVLSRAHMPDMGAPCVLARLAFRAPENR